MKKHRNDQIIQVEEGVYLDSDHLYDLKQMICLIIDKAAEDTKNEIPEEDILAGDFSIGVGGRESMLISWLRKRQEVITISTLDARLFEHIYRTVRSTCFSLVMRYLPIETQRPAFVDNLSWYRDITHETEDPMPDMMFCDACARPMLEGEMIESISFLQHNLRLSKEDRVAGLFKAIPQINFCENCGRGLKP